MWETIADFSAIIIADLILSGDNALIIGMAAAGLAPDLRKKAILYGMVIAAVHKPAIIQHKTFSTRFMRGIDQRF